MPRKPEIAEKLPEEESPELLQARALLARKIDALHGLHGEQPSDLPNLKLFRHTEPTACTSAAYEPTFIVYVQGEKRINVGGAIHVVDQSCCQLTSVDIPILSQVTRASEQEPILALVLKLQMQVVREILSTEEFLLADPAARARGVVIGKTSLEILQACSRLLDLLDTPRDIPFLGNLMQREIVYRLLRGPLGSHLRAIATLGDQSNRTARAVAWLQANYHKPLSVEQLASVAQMGVSTFHHHFRTLTSMSPLQYQKRLRLHMARVRMVAGDLDAASAAFEVGYESASQFSREYRRLFGQPPMRDVKTRLLSGDSAA
jgi:AraC-like DNA-binding protein